MMEKINEQGLQLFEDQAIRTAWDEEHEEWYFSIVDVVGVLIGVEIFDTARKYWNKLKQRLKEEGNESVTKCHQLKMKSPKDGKRYKTDVANTEQLLRIIQSIPFQAISARKELTDEWRDRGITGSMQYALLTDELTKTWSGMTTRQYKTHKGLKKESLRDNMSTTELVLNMLAETSTKEISKVTKPEGFEANKNVAQKGGSIAAVARQALEEETGQSVITNRSATELNHVVSAMLTTSALLSEGDDQ